MIGLIKIENKAERCEDCIFNVCGRCGAKHQIYEVLGDCGRGFDYIFQVDTVTQGE